MTKYNVPKREHANGPKKMVSLRLPNALIKEIEKMAELKGWTTTDLVTTVLDQYIQFEQKKTAQNR